MIRFPVTSKFETVKFAKVATPGTYKFASVASGPVKFILDVTLRVCVFAVAMFAVVANTFVVVTALDAYKLFESERLTKFETCQTFKVPTFAVVANTFVVVTAFETLIFPVTFRVVFPVAPTIVAVDKFEIP
jgi:hypothetical protein